MPDQILSQAATHSPLQLCHQDDHQVYVSTDRDAEVQQHSPALFWKSNWTLHVANLTSELWEQVGASLSEA